MAAAGSPASTAPSSARSTSRAVKSGTTAVASASTAAIASEIFITCWRPMRSASTLPGISISARPAAVADTVRLALAALTPKSLASSGSSGCVL